MEPLPTDATDFAYDLPAKNYEDLRIDVLIPRLLIVVTVPLGETDWYVHSEQELLLRRCGYYASLAGKPPSSNKATVRVKLPRANVLSPVRLTELMAKIETGAPL